MCGGSHAAYSAGAQPDGEPHGLHGRQWGQIGGGSDCEPLDFGIFIVQYFEIKRIFYEI